MPEYHSENHRLLGRVVVRPVPRYRAWLRFLPYYVGDRVRFHLDLKKHITGPELYERFGDSIRLVGPDHAIYHGGGEVIGRPISSEGDLEYYIGWGNNERVTLVTAHAISRDRWLPTLVTILVTAAVTLACTLLGALLTGIFDIEKLVKIIPQ